MTQIHAHTSEENGKELEMMYKIKICVSWMIVQIALHEKDGSARGKMRCQSVIIASGPLPGTILYSQLF